MPASPLGLSPPPRRQDADVGWRALYATDRKGGLYPLLLEVTQCRCGASSVAPTQEEVGNVDHVHVDSYRAEGDLAPAKSSWDDGGDRLGEH